MALYSQITHQSHDWDMMENMNTCPNKESGIFAEVPRASKQHGNSGVGSPGLVAKQRTSAQEETNKGYSSKEHRAGEDLQSKTAGEEDLMPDMTGAFDSFGPP